MVKARLSRAPGAGAHHAESALRSLLLVSAVADDLVQAFGAGADALVVDLPSDLDATALAAIHDALAGTAADETRPLVFVRLAAIDDPALDAALAALMPAGPDGVMLGRCRGGADVQHLAVKLAMHEAEQDLADGQTMIIAEIGAVPRTLLTLDGLPGCSPRLVALAWNPTAFAAELGLEAAGDEPAPSALARSLVVIAAKAAEVAAIEWSSEGDDDAIVRHQSVRARRDGFNARIARNAAQIPAIHAGFEA